MFWLFKVNLKNKNTLKRTRKHPRNKKTLKNSRVSVSQLAKMHFIENLVHKS